MTTMTLPLSSTGGATRAVTMRRGAPETHTAILYESVPSTRVSEQLQSFDLVFEATTVLRMLVAHELTQAETTQIGSASSAVSTVEHLSDLLGIPVRDVLRAARVRKRTFQNWKRNPATRPRLSSHGDLWRLAQSVEVLVDRLGEDLPTWMRQDVERLKMLGRGDFTGLVRDATQPIDRLPEMLLRERHLTAGTYGDDDYELPPRRGPIHVEEAPPARHVGPEDR